MTRYRLRAGRVRSTGWETAREGFWPGRWLDCTFRCRFDFAHLTGA